MKKIVLLAFVLVLFLMSMLGNWQFVVTVSGSTTHHVFTGQSIQEAINSAQSGDTIFVHSGTYHEPVIVNKTLSLVGENQTTTIIDGNRTGYVVRLIEISDSNITGFTIQNGLKGIHMIASSRNCITNNIVSNIEFGFFFERCSSNGISNNHVIDNGRKNHTQGSGMYLKWSNSNTIQDNVVKNNYWTGILLWESNENTFYGNFVANNSYHDIDLKRNSNNNVFVENTVVNTGRKGATGFYVGDCSGRPYNNKFCRNIVMKHQQGFLLDCSRNNSLHENIIKENRFGIEAWGSSHNIYKGNIIANNTDLGIVAFKGGYNYFIDNLIPKDGEYGILLSSSSNNTVTHNFLGENIYGLYFYNSGNNSVTYNNFVDNEHAAFKRDSPSFSNLFSKNYWSNYNGTDSDQDGIGDIPYIIDENSTDNSPLMVIFSDFPVIHREETYHVTTICNSTISGVQLANITEMAVNDEPVSNTFKVIFFNVTGEEGTSGFCRICIPTALMNDTYKVFVNGTEIPYNLLSCSNSTHNYLYFTYNHSTQEVIIVPEFPTWTSMLLILILLTVSIAIYKRRLLKKTNPLNNNLHFFFKFSQTKNQRTI